MWDKGGGGEHGYPLSAGDKQRLYRASINHLETDGRSLFF